VQNTICIRAETLANLHRHAQRDYPRECCGLLAGRVGVVERGFAAVNAAADPARNYEIAPKELFSFMREIRVAGFDLMGIYHSHPKGDNYPSSTDIERAYYPGVAYFILSADPVRQSARAFSIRDGIVTELRIAAE
jgi:proteasome lid subunit RPN8/RPN11